MCSLWLFLPVFFAKSLVTIILSSLFLYNIKHVISTVLLNKPKIVITKRIFVLFVTGEALCVYAM